MMLLNRDLVIFRVFLFRVTSRRFCIISKSEKSDSLHQSKWRDILFGRLTIQASSIRTTRTFHSDLPLYREPSNYSSLHSSGRLSNTAGRLLVFDKQKDFVTKHKYRKTAATVKTMCVPVSTLSLIWQVVHTKFNRPDDSFHGPDAQALYMEIACNNSTIRTSYFMVRTLKALV
jgi:hypothetical protein